MSDLIDRQAAIDALWKALYEYEDKTENQFQESEDLEVEDWIGHRIFVQNMNDIDRQTIQNLPSAQPEIIRCKDCKLNPKYEWFGCPMSHLSEKQRPETAWCWKAERRNDDADVNT